MYVIKNLFRWILKTNSSVVQSSRFVYLLTAHARSSARRLGGSRNVIYTRKFTRKFPCSQFLRPFFFFVVVRVLPNQQLKQIIIIIIKMKVSLSLSLAIYLKRPDSLVVLIKSK